ncbi:MAG: hypothetical protein RQ751_10905, partial [Longimicrobiales bacterium]|nr:hypothetical protein [Longimicrobiales bacterium]
MRSTHSAYPILLLASLLGACGPSPDPAGELESAGAGELEPARAGGPETGPGRVVIRMLDDMTFDPANPLIALGDTIVWVNAGTLPHTATADP